MCVTGSPERCLQRCERQPRLNEPLITALCIDASHKDINGSYSVMDGRQIKGVRTGSCHSQTSSMHLHHKKCLTHRAHCKPVSNAGCSE